MSTLVIEIEVPDADPGREHPEDVALLAMNATPRKWTTWGFWRFGPSGRVARFLAASWMEES